jgi:1-acyl-sn-glycerol-3-phosphate acyltransferase
MLAHGLWTACVRAYVAGFHHLSVTGRENLPLAAPFVLVANHCSHLDTLSLLAAMPRNLSGRTFALAAGEVFFASLPAAGFAAFAINALPVWRKRTSAGDLAFLRERLVEDKLILILFPEGTRSRTGEMAAFKPGLGGLVAGLDVPVVPCLLDGTFAAWPAGRRLPRPRRVGLRIGVPLSFATTANDKRGWVTVAAACEAAVRSLGNSGQHAIAPTETGET